MYLYLGGDIAVPLRVLVGIFDLDTVTVSRHSREFLKRAQQDGRVRDAGGGRDLPKSFVLTDKGVALSPLGSATLQKRVPPLTLRAISPKGETGEP